MTDPRDPNPQESRSRPPSPRPPGSGKKRPKRRGGGGANAPQSRAPSGPESRQSSPPIEDAEPALRALNDRINDAAPGDRPRFRKRLRGIRRAIRERKPVDRAIAGLGEDLDRAIGERDRRARRVPTITYPPELPISERRDEIARAIRDHQVVIVCGETGSGKSTQLPKICLDLGRGIDGLIGHTQPRRIAARTIAARLAEEIGQPLGKGVGYKVRFNDRTSPETLIKVMTDGVLLAEAQGDREFRRYDTLIIDEAHERSLNIDFLLGMLKRVLPRRRDLKLIVTSATIDPDRFSKHFSGAPVIEVSGRTYPVEVRHRPLHTGDDGDQERDEIEGVVEAVGEIERSIRGDILAFFPGEREIRQAADALRKRQGPALDVLPLFARLSNDEQQRVFNPKGGTRRIVLATNVAETSVTVPRIGAVIDTGLARISRFSPRTKTQRLEIEPISRASADQRKGRCGRLGPGLCIRLYSEEDFAGREEFTPPEILRTNLAGVILRMKSLGLGEVEDFPFVEPPDSRQVREGQRTLLELGAVDTEGALTELGRDLARLPIDPRIGRMVIGGAEFGCEHEALVLAAALSVPDVRDRPFDKRDAADEAHEQFAVPESDFLGLLRIWDAYHEQAKKLKRRRLASWCRDRFLSFLRLREWHDVFLQLKDLAGEIGIREQRRRDGPRVIDPDAVHRALLTGLVSNVGRKGETHEYLAPHGVRFSLFPGSVLFGEKPEWVMAAELVRTTRLFARTVAKIKPEWIESAAGPLVTRTYHEPFWEPRRGRVNAYEKVSLYGLEIIPRRKVHYGPIDPELSHGTFIHRALVEGEYATGAPFARHNRELFEQIGKLEDRLRRRDLVADKAAQFEFYAARVPKGIYTGAAFERWRQQAEKKDPKLLFMSIEDVQAAEPGEKLKEFPERVAVGGASVEASYRFAPGERDDGATLTVPIEALSQLSAAGADWAVPGLVREKTIELVRSLPKAYRRAVGPAGEFCDAFLASEPSRDVPLWRAVGRYVAKLTGTSIPDSVWRFDQLPEHLRVNYRVVDEAGEVLAEGRDLDSVRRDAAASAPETAGEVYDERFTRDELETWDLGDLPESVAIDRGGMRMTIYPALVVRDGVIGVRAFDEAHRAALEHRRAAAALLERVQRAEIKRMVRGLPELERIAMVASPLGVDAKRVRAAMARWIAERVMIDRPPPRTRGQFERTVEESWNDLGRACREVPAAVLEVLERRQQLVMGLERRFPAAFERSIADVADRLRALAPDDLFESLDWARLRFTPRYLAALQRRMERLGSGGLDRDLRAMGELRPLDAMLAELRVSATGSKLAYRADEIAEQMEELRVSLFAHELGTRRTVSVTRLRRAMEELAGELAAAHRS